MRALLSLRAGLIVLVAACLTAAGQVGILADQAGSSSQAAGIRLDVAPGTKASYRVREQLAGYDLPNDAVGTTDAVSGSIFVAADGAIDATRSKVTVELGGLTSDQGMRDNYIRSRTLETEKFSSAEFVPRRVEGLTFPLPTGGEIAFRLIGDMTVRGVTRELVWQVAAAFKGDQMTAKATTSFPFSTFDMTIPRVSRVLSVNDEIRLELDLVLRRTALP